MVGNLSVVEGRVTVRICAICLCIGSAIGTMLLGVAYYVNIHHIGYFIAVQIFSGALQVVYIYI